MPKRSVDTAIWADHVFSELSGCAQLVYLRLITGDDTGPHGATRAPAKRIASDTNLERTRVDEAIAELVESALVRRYDDWLWMPTWIRYQAHSPNFLRAARHASRECPTNLRVAIGRALDTIAPRKGKTGSDEPGTENPPDTSTNVEGSETHAEPIGNPSEREGQGQGQVPSSLREEEGTVRTPTPATPPAPTSAGAESGGSAQPHDPDHDDTQRRLQAEQDLLEQPAPPPPDWAAIGGTIADVHERTSLATLQPRTDPHLPDDPEERRHHVEAALNGNGAGKTCKTCRAPWTGLGVICDTCIETGADLATADPVSTPEGTP